MKETVMGNLAEMKELAEIQRKFLPPKKNEKKLAIKETINCLETEAKLLKKEINAMSDEYSGRSGFNRFAYYELYNKLDAVNLKIERLRRKHKIFC